MTNSVSGEAKAVVRRNTEEVQGKGNFDVFEELFDEDFVVALVNRKPVKMAEVTVRVQVIADTLLQLLHVRKAAIRFALPDDLAIVRDHKDAAGSGLQ